MSDELGDQLRDELEGTLGKVRDGLANHTTEGQLDAITTFNDICFNLCGDDRGRWVAVATILSHLGMIAGTASQSDLTKNGCDMIMALCAAVLSQETCLRAIGFHDGQS